MRLCHLIICAVFASDPVRAFSTQLASDSVAGVNVVTAGINNDGSVSVSEALQQLIGAQPSATFFFPPGIYLLHNDGPERSGLRLEEFAGTLRMAKGARFVCDIASTSAGQCLWLYRCQNASFENLTITYSDVTALPLARPSAVSNALLVENSQDLSFFNTTVLGSTGSGIWNTNSSRISYSGTTTIRDTSADGIHFENVGDATLTNLFTDETGDDALAVTVLAKSDPHCGLNVNNVHIHNSHSRGIATAGACNAIFTNLIINGTANSALAATRDESIESRRSTRIKFAHAEIHGAGTLRGVAGNGHCIDIGDSSEVTAIDISCTTVRENGVFVYDNATAIVLQDVMLTSAGNNGFQAVNASQVSFLNVRSTASAGNGFDIEGSSHVMLRDCRTDDAGGSGFFHSRDTDLTESDLVSRNSATKHGNNRAWWAEEMIGPLTLHGLVVTDDQTTPTGYLVGEDSNGASQVLVSGIAFQISNGSGSIQRNSSRSLFLTSGQTRPALDRGMRP